MGDVIEIVLDTPLKKRDVLDLATEAIALRKAGNPGLDEVTLAIDLHCSRKEDIVVNKVRTRADNAHTPPQHIQTLR